MLGVDIPDEMEQKIEEEVEEGMFKNKSEMVRSAIRQYFRQKDVSYRERLRLEAISRGDIIDVDELSLEAKERLE